MMQYDPRQQAQLGPYYNYSMGGTQGGFMGNAGGLAGSITAVALAYYQGSEESKKFNQAMAVTNQFAGIGIDRFNDLTAQKTSFFM